MGKKKRVPSSAVDVDEVSQLLKNWGVPERFIKNFKDNDVTNVKRLRSLDQNAIELMIPEDTPREDFQYSLNLYRKSTPSSSHNNDQVDSEADDVDGDDNNNSTAVTRKRKRSQVVINLNDIQGAPEINALHAYLKKSVPGNIVLAFFKSHGHLDNYSRDLLCQQTIFQSLEGDYNIKITREKFDEIANNIVAIFTSESKETWYDVVKKGKSSSVYGRLRHKYYSVRRGLVDAGLIPKKRLLEDLETIGDLDNDGELLGPDEDDPDYQFLLHNVEPWPEVEAKWNATRARRLRNLSQLSQNEEYVALFPCLQKPLGYTLILLDGVHKEKSLNIDFKTLWRSYKKFLLVIIRQEKPEFLQAEGDISVSEEEEFVRIILEIPTLFKVRALPKSTHASKSSKCWRPSMSEIKNAFCLHVKTISQIQEKSDVRRNSLRTYKFPLTPVPVLVGPANNIRQCLITLGDLKWEVDSPWAAVFGAFKMCFGFESVYPIEAKHLFLFLQRTLLNFEKSDDFKLDRGLKSFISGRIKDFEIYSAALARAQANSG